MKMGRLLSMLCRLLSIALTFAIALIVYYMYFVVKAKPLKASRSESESESKSESASRSFVELFVPAQTDCTHLAYFGLPKFSVSGKVCTHDIDVDKYVSGSVQVAGMWEMRDVETMLSLMCGDLNKTVCGCRLSEGTSTRQGGRPSAQTSRGTPAKSSGDKSLSVVGREPGDGEDPKSNDISLVDLGCHIGVYTMAAALSGYKVLSVDAMSSSLQLLATSLRLANLSSRVTLVNNAVYDVRQSAVVVDFSTKKNIGGSSVHLLGESNRDSGLNLDKKKTGLRSICMDDLIPFVPSRRVFLKMDIESAEWRALRCAAKFFQEIDVPFLQMEWLRYKSSKTENERRIILDFLLPRGYRPHSRCQPIPRPWSVERSGKWSLDNILWVKTANSKNTGDSSVALTAHKNQKFAR